MGIKFDKRYVDIARREYPAVYVDQETPEQFIGSLTKYTGDRIRIYTTNWFYEMPMIFKSNEEFKRWLEQDVQENYDGIEWAMPSFA